MSRKAFLAGIPVLLNFCASENFKDVKKIYWIEMHDITSKKDVSMDYSNNISMANMITNFFGYELIKGNRYNFDQDNKRNNFDNIDDLPIEEGDIVSENVSMYQTKKFIDLKVESFPEGAATYNQLYNLHRSYLTLPMTGKLRKLYIRLRRKPGMIFSKKWLIPDFMNISSKLVKNMDEYEVLSYKNINKNYGLFFNFLDQRYKIKNLFGEEKVYIHPIFPVYPLKEYESWINFIKERINPFSVILKKHPADHRQFKSTFKGFQLLNPILSSIPLEVFFCQENLFYVGYHSTTLLMLDPSKVKIIPPLNKKIMNSRKMNFHGLRGLFLEQWEKRWEN
jgi:hypothetical protein